MEALSLVDQPKMNNIDSNEDDSEEDDLSDVDQPEMNNIDSNEDDSEEDDLSDLQEDNITMVANTEALGSMSLCKLTIIIIIA